MSAKRVNKTAEEIFNSAADIDALDERSAYLDQACGGDAALRAEAEELLRHDADAGSFLEKPPEELEATVETDMSDVDSDETWRELLTSSEAPDCIGDLGTYEINELIGRGGMGVVLRADPKLNRVVAIKMLAPELAANAMSVRRFLREAQAAAAVSHDHVVTIHAIDEQARPPLIVMEYIDGQSLQEKIDKEGALDVKSILRIGMQTTAGLAAAHRQGLVHRDIKPSNILLENGIERVKLTDFGLARAVDDTAVTRTGQITGTPQYMSPEQAQGQRLDHRTDLFSLGCVLYAMCTGRAAFRADSAVAVMHRVVHDAPRPIRELNEDIPEWLCEIIDKLLAKRPTGRFDSAEEVEELLGRHLAHLQQPGSHPRPQRLDMGPPSRRQSGRPALLGLVVLPALVLLGIWLIAMLSANLRGASENVKQMTLAVGLIGMPTAIGGLLILWSRSRSRWDIQRTEQSEAGLGSTNTSSSMARRKVTITLGGLAAAGVVGLAAVIYVELSRGTLVVESEDPTVRLRIHPLVHESSEAKKRRFKIQYPGHTITGNAEVRLRPGPYKAFLDDGYGDRIELSQSQFVLGAGERVVVKVRRKSHPKLPGDLSDVANQSSVVTDSSNPVVPFLKLTETWGEDGNQQPIVALDVSSDGKWLVSVHRATKDVQHGLVSLWPVVKKGQTRDGFQVPLPAEVTDVAFSPTGDTYAWVQSDGQLRLKRAAASIASGNNEIEPVEGPLFCLAWSPDGSRIIGGGDGKFYVWKLTATQDKAERLDSVQVPTRRFSEDARVLDVSWSPHGSQLAVGCSHGGVYVFDVTLPKPRLIDSLHNKSDGHDENGAAFSIAWAPDSKSIEYGCANGTVQMRSVDGRSHGFHGGLGSPAEPERQHQPVAWSPDGSVIATVEGDDYDRAGMPRTWHLTLRRRGGKNDRVLGESHTGEITSLAFTSDGRHLISGSEDSTIRWWRFQEPVGPAAELPPDP